VRLAGLLSGANQGRFHYYFEFKGDFLRSQGPHTLAANRLQGLKPCQFATLARHDCGCFKVTVGKKA